MLPRVRRLTGIAVARPRARCDGLDARTGAVVAFLRDLDGRGDVIRAHRDWLHGSPRGWDPIAAEWERAAADRDEATRLLVGRTYRFLAPRSMPGQQ